MAQAPIPNLPSRLRSRPAAGTGHASLRSKIKGFAGRGRLFSQLSACFLALALLPLLIVGYFNYHYAADGMLKNKEENLQALVIRQSGEVLAYFDQMRMVAQFLSSATTIRTTLGAIGNTTLADYDALPNSPAMQAVVNRSSARYAELLAQLDVTNIYVVNPQGLVVYHAGGSGPAWYNLETAPANGWGLAKLFHQILAKPALSISGYTVQTPDGKPAFYYGAPVYSSDNNGQFLGILIFSLDVAEIQKVLNNRVGLGQTGETIAVARENGKFRLVNQPPHQSGVVYAEITPLDEQTKFGDGITASGQALVAEGRDYLGDEVLAAWTYLPSLGWTLIQKVDRTELLEPVIQLRDFSLLAGGITLVLVLLAAGLLARGITHPVVQLTQVAERIAQGDLSETITVRAGNEIGLLAQAVGTMGLSLKSLVRRVQDAAALISNNAVQMSASSRQQAETAQTTGAAAIEVSATARQISATSQELTDTMEEVSRVAQDTAQRAESGLDGLEAIQNTMGELEKARASVAGQLQLIAQKAAAIGGITVTMTKVADQTNLLSLNAAIEARKAGEYGRGFNVVAREIQRLADQAGVATLDIERTIAEMLQAVEAGVEGMRGFSTKAAAGLERVQAVSQQLTGVIQQVQGLPPRFEMVLQGMQSQSEGAKQITESIAHMSESAQQTAASINEALLLLEQLRETTRALQGEISLFRV